MRITKPNPATVLACTTVMSAHPWGMTPEKAQMDSTTAV